MEVEHDISFVVVAPFTLNAVTTTKEIAMGSCKIITARTEDTARNCVVIKTNEFKSGVSGCDVQLYEKAVSCIILVKCKF